MSPSPPDREEKKTGGSFAALSSREITVSYPDSDTTNDRVSQMTILPLLIVMGQNVSIFTFAPEKKIPRQRIFAVTTMRQIKVKIHACTSKWLF